MRAALRSARRSMSAARTPAAAAATRAMTTLAPNQDDPAGDAIPVKRPIASHRTAAPTAAPTETAKTRAPLTRDVDLSVTSIDRAPPARAAKAVPPPSTAPTAAQYQKAVGPP